MSLHRALPFVGHEVRLQPRPGVIATSEIQLSVRELTAWGGWSAVTRAFIASHGEAMALRPLIQRHGELVVELNLWLYGCLADANAPALAAVNQLVVECNAILGGTDLAEARRVTEVWTARRESAGGDRRLEVELLRPRRKRA